MQVFQKDQGHAESRRDATEVQMHAESRGTQTKRGKAEKKDIEKSEGRQKHQGHAETRKGTIS